MNRWMAMVAVAAVAASATAAPYVVLKNGQRKDGVTIRAKADGSVFIIDSNGVRFDYTRDQYVQAVTDKPAGLDAAVAAVQAKKYDEAAPALQKIMTDMRFLEWDRTAGIELVKALQGKKDFEGAIRTYDVLMKDYPKLETDPEAGWSYRELVFGAKQFARLEPMLVKLLAGENRTDAARALVMRGDIRASENKPEMAVRDYLRAVLFYERESTVIPAALVRTAQALERMRDPRAKEFYRRVVEEYADAPEAAQAKGKL